MADAGARRIKRILDTPSTNLAKRTNAVRKGMAAANDAEGQVSGATYGNISDLRRSYATLARTIKAINTRSSAKADVLDALARMDTALANLAAGLRKGTSSAAMTDLRNARRRARRAGTDLKRAAARLA